MSWHVCTQCTVMVVMAFEECSHAWACYSCAKTIYSDFPKSCARKTSHCYTLTKPNNFGTSCTLNSAKKWSSQCWTGGLTPVPMLSQKIMGGCGELLHASACLGMCNQVVRLVIVGSMFSIKGWHCLLMCHTSRAPHVTAEYTTIYMTVRLHVPRHALAVVPTYNLLLTGW